MKIGDLSVSPRLVLAPMAGYTHAAFRELVADYGGCGLYYTEMLNSRYVAGNNPARDPFLATGTGDRPLIAQLAGNDPEILARSCRRAASLGRFDGFDFNLGCPRGSVQRFGWGAGLLRDPERVAVIVERLRRATPGPLLVKIRDPEPEAPLSLEVLIRMLEGAGADAIVLHARNARDRFKRPADWKRITYAKSLTTRPLIGNGDVFSPLDARTMLEQTGCDAVMIGRAALMRPWIFRDTRRLLEDGALPDPPSPVSVWERYHERVTTLRRREERSRDLRLFAFWFLQNFPFGRFYYQGLARLNDPDAVFAQVREAIAGERFRPYPCRPFMNR